jgi:hypothetical protein
MLRLTFLCCGVCSRNIDEATIMDDDDVVDGHFWSYSIPPRRYRRKIAPQLCDRCWLEHRSAMLRYRWGRNGRACVPPFRQIYLWQWVAQQLEKQGKDRLRPHYAAKAQRGLEVMTR